MNNFRNFVGRKNISVLFAIFFSFFVAVFASAHGPKGHSRGDFTTFQAAKKGIGLYDRLLSSGKLEESWETDLATIEIYKKSSGAQKELVVKFSRLVSEPRSVFIFFSEKGDYKASNFTGK